MCTSSGRWWSPWRRWTRSSLSSCRSKRSCKIDPNIAWQRLWGTALGYEERYLRWGEEARCLLVGLKKKKKTPSWSCYLRMILCGSSFVSKMRKLARWRKSPANRNTLNIFFFFFFPLLLELLFVFYFWFFPFLLTTIFVQASLSFFLSFLPFPQTSTPEKAKEEEELQRCVFFFFVLFEAELLFFSCCYFLLLLFRFDSLRSWRRKKRKKKKNFVVLVFQP